MIKLRTNLLEAVAVTAVVILGLLNLSLPFDGDQALFNVIASKMSGGAVLYRDFWDLKQPAIFYFYMVGGKLFGFTEVGVHLFELLYMTAFCVVMLAALKDYFENPWARSLVPVLTVGLYYGVTGSWHLTQAEGLACFPMFLSLRFAAEASRRKEGRARLLFLSGLAGAVVLLFKFLFVPIPVGFWLTAIVSAVLKDGEKIPRAMVRVCLPVALGTIPLLIITFGYYTWAATPDILSYTFFEYPARAMAELPKPSLDRLLDGLRWFVGWAAPVLALGFVGAGASLRRERDSLTFNLVLWVVLGFGVIFVQRLSWWEYHYMLLLFPLGILAAKGLDVMWKQVQENNPAGRSRGVRAVAAVSLLLLFSPVLFSLCLKSYALARHGFALSGERRRSYQSNVSPHYRTALSETAFLSEPSSLSGAIFVGGNPIFYHLSGRGPAVASNGWMLELFLPEQWERLTRELETARPPYIFISAEYPETIKTRSPRTDRFIEENYVELRGGEAGQWYVLRDGVQGRSGDDP